MTWLRRFPFYYLSLFILIFNIIVTYNFTNISICTSSCTSPYSIHVVFSSNNFCFWWVLHFWLSQGLLKIITLSLMLSLLITLFIVYYWCPLSLYLVSIFNFSDPCVINLKSHLKQWEIICTSRIHIDGTAIYFYPIRSNCIFRTYQLIYTIIPREGSRNNLPSKFTKTDHQWP